MTAVKVRSASGGRPALASMAEEGDDDTLSPGRGSRSTSGVKTLDHVGVLLDDASPLQLQGGSQRLVVRAWWRIDQVERLDARTAGVMPVHLLDLLRNERSDFPACTQGAEVGERHLAFLGPLLHVLVVDHDEARQVRPAIADHDGVG